MCARIDTYMGTINRPQEEVYMIVIVLYVRMYVRQVAKRVQAKRLWEDFLIAGSGLCELQVEVALS